LVADSHQSCADPAAVQENEIPSPSAAAATCSAQLQMHRIHPSSVKLHAASK